jgi:YesN/AraC family two-component response regulator
MAKMVLVVDDNAVIRQALCRLFSSEPGFDVCGEAENGQDAIEKAQVLHPHLIVMDLSMPVMNGIDAARTLKTFSATTATCSLRWKLSPQGYAPWSQSLSLCLC